jgi:hypothetical protein
MTPSAAWTVRRLTFCALEQVVLHPPLHHQRRLQLQRSPLQELWLQLFLRQRHLQPWPLLLCLPSSSPCLSCPSFAALSSTVQTIQRVSMHLAYMEWMTYSLLRRRQLLRLLFIFIRHFYSDKATVCKAIARGWKFGCDCKGWSSNVSTFGICDFCTPIYFPKSFPCSLQ